MSKWNSVYIEGYVVKQDSDLRRFNDKNLVKFSISVYYGKEKKSFFDVEFWCDGTPEYKRGEKVCINGYLYQDKWTKDGKTFSKVIIRADEIGVERKEKDVPLVQDTIDDIPF